MRTIYSGSPDGARKLMIDRLLASGWPQDAAISHVNRIVGALPVRRGPVRFDRAAAEAAGTFTADEWHAIVTQYGRCLRCNRDDVPLVPDHIVPLSREGLHVAENIQPLCNPCNIWKGIQMIDYRCCTSATPSAGLV